MIFEEDKSHVCIDCHFYLTTFVAAIVAPKRNKRQLLRLELIRVKDFVQNVILNFGDEKMPITFFKIFTILIFLCSFLFAANYLLIHNFSNQKYYLPN